MANTTQIFVRNPVGDLTNHGDIHKIQRLTFSFNAYSSETSDVNAGSLRLWPPRSPDLSPLDFCLWGYLKSKVYSPCPATLNQLQANITREVAQLDPVMVRRAMLDMSARAVKCITTGGGRFEKQTSDYPFLVREICCRFATYVSFIFHTLVQEIKYMLSKSNTCQKRIAQTRSRRSPLFASLCASLD